MHERHRRARDVQQRIVEVLLHHWDPIGVRDLSEAQDEYDGYVGGVYRLLLSATSDQLIIDHLYSIEVEAMGLNPREKARLLPVVQRLRTLDVTPGTH